MFMSQLMMMSFSELIEFLYNNFPVKHKKNCKRPELKDPSNRVEKRRVCFILASLYHPDKIQVNEHGLKYKVLCEEITKVINGRLGDL